jgi:hypothetical protein
MREAAAGVTEFEGDEFGPVPKELVADTTKVYAVPLVNPVMMIGEEPPERVMPPGLAVTQ